MRRLLAKQYDTTTSTLLHSPCNAVFSSFMTSSVLIWHILISNGFLPHFFGNAVSYPAGIIGKPYCRRHPTLVTSPPIPHPQTFRLGYAPSSGTAQYRYEDVAPGTARYTVDQLSDSTEYRFSISAHNRLGRGAVSPDTVTASTTGEGGAKLWGRGGCEGEGKQGTERGGPK